MMVEKHSLTMEKQQDIREILEKGSMGWKDEAEKVDHPSHYGGGDNPYEVIKVLENWLSREQFIGALKFNIIKYQARADAKGHVEDYAKAAWYANYLVEFLRRTDGKG